MLIESALLKENVLEGGLHSQVRVVACDHDRYRRKHGQVDAELVKGRDERVQVEIFEDSR